MPHRSNPQRLLRAGFKPPDLEGRPNRLPSLVKPGSLVHVRVRSDWARLLALGIGIPLATSSIATDGVGQRGLLICYGCSGGFWWDMLCEAQRLERGMEEVPVVIGARDWLHP